MTHFIVEATFFGKSKPLSAWHDRATAFEFITTLVTLSGVQQAELWACDQTTIQHPYYSAMKINECNCHNPAAHPFPGDLYDLHPSGSRPQMPR